MATKTTAKAKKQATETEITPPKPKSKATYYYAAGKRKTSVVKVRMTKGTGEITVNGKDVLDYFHTKTLVNLIKSPFVLIGAVDKFDISAVAEGGGISSQAEALRHGIAKALVVNDPTNRSTIKKAGFITRDSRIKERKKFGLHRARRAPQFSKR
ncbi:MAG: 30S ribosomal protein S9 [Patescibacteria group bacterium]